jgi:hypothetical protein
MTDQTPEEELEFSEPETYTSEPEDNDGPQDDVSTEGL